ncbi:FAD-binding oxidoreductase [Streptomyces sp. SAJ15]|uniref:FAD-binding oxidoreductase n=1 Tax=Streptomyces sp. SAJ15 TaxID=2011095 RepID=UPI001185CC2E|nr:FAD-binding oxidoreductase [Streptomyces sp. SAJ15]TVL91523.1 FAD-linked oxidoreductase [Streptomyces sp. SAJ15]
MGGPTPHASDIEGTVVRRGEADYRDVRAGELWNRFTPDRHPDAIVRAASERDVPPALELARSQGWRVAVRAGGHSWCGSPLRDSGLLLDLSALRRHHIDTAAATAVVQPGVVGAELAGELATRGLAFPAGHCGNVAVGGYLLSGGLGWNSGQWGPACAGVRGIDAVTADGAVVHCDENEHSELFWAARGAGPGFFAVVTAFHLALRPRPAALATTSYVCPSEDLETAVRWATEAARELPAHVELSFTLAAMDPTRPPTAGGEVVLGVVATAFAESRDGAGRALAPLSDHPDTVTPVSRRIAEPTTLDALYAASARLWPENHRCVADTLWSDADYVTLLSRLAAALGRAPSGRSLVLAPLKPASTDPELLRNMAFSVLGTSYAVPYAIWDDPARDEANVDWLRDTMAAVEPLGTGHYIAEADLTADPSRARRSFTPEDWDRLGAVRTAYDPHGVFHPYLSP